MTVQKLAQALKLEPSRLVEDLFGQNFTFRTSRDEVPEAIAREVSLRHGVALTVKKTIVRDTSVSTVSPQPQKPVQGPQSQSTTLPISTSPEKTDRDAELVKYLCSPGFPSYGRAVDRYLAILGWILEHNPQGKPCLLAFKRGRRRYFATTAEEIEQRAASPNVKPIGATGLYALTTTDTATKRSIVAEIMKCCGLGLDARERATQSILS